jgi:hypothetical protein
LRELRDALGGHDQVNWETYLEAAIDGVSLKIHLEADI